MRAILCVFLLCGAALVHGQDTSAKLTIAPAIDICKLPPDSGPCDAAIPRYYFNYKTNTCEKFIYGGCKGNANNFKTLEACLKKCKPTTKVCSLKPDPGPCKALFYRWYFNPTTGKCEQFKYGGCGGNKNNFKTRSACQKACRKDCKYLYCIVNPCTTTKCPAFPKADCIPHYCNGCHADFFVNGKLVDCKIKPCLGVGKKCPTTKSIVSADDVSAKLKCCPGMTCCACGPPVLPADYVPPKFGTCQYSCICPKG